MAHCEGGGMKHEKAPIHTWTMEEGPKQDKDTKI